MPRSIALPDLLITACLLLLLLSASALSQEQQKDDSALGSLTRAAGKTTVVVVGSAAKGAWATTKFTAQYAVKPVAKTVFKKAAPAAAKLALKTTGAGVKRVLPVAIKLALL